MVEVVWWEGSRRGQEFTRDVGGECGRWRGRIGCEGEEEESDMAESVEGVQERRRVTDAVTVMTGSAEEEHEGDIHT